MKGGGRVQQNRARDEITKSVHRRSEEVNSLCLSFQSNWIKNRGLHFMCFDEFHVDIYKSVELWIHPTFAPYKLCL